MTDLLGGWSCHVLAAPDAEAAVALLDVVLSDFHLDRAPGLDTLAAIIAPTATRRSPPS